MAMRPVFFKRNPTTVIPAEVTVEKAQNEAEGILSFRIKRRQERIPDGSLGDAEPEKQ